MILRYSLLGLVVRTRFERMRRWEWFVDVGRVVGSSGLLLRGSACSGLSRLSGRGALAGLVLLLVLAAPEHAFEKLLHVLDRIWWNARHGGYK